MTLWQGVFLVILGLVILGGVVLAISGRDID